MTASLFKDQYPMIDRAMRLIEEDNGGHLLEFYGVGPCLDIVVERKARAVEKDFTAQQLAMIEGFLANLPDQKLEAIGFGSDDGEDLSWVPLLVDQFLNAAFEADWSEESRP